MKYAWDIREGKIVSCAWVKLAVERHFRDLEKAKKKSFPYFFDEYEAETVLSFFDFLRHSQGEWAGQTFELAPWEAFVVWCIHGWREKKTGFRRFRTVYLSVARKNGKTTFAAGHALYMFDGDNEPGAQVYAAATKLEQAKITHGEAARMVKSSPMLRDRIGIHANNLHNLETNSKFEPLGRDHSTMDGLNVHHAVVDELHAHKTREVWDIIDTATGARRQALILAITTAGFNRQSICYEQHTHCQNVLEGVMIEDGFSDETFFGMVFTLDQGDDWKDENNWIKANPNIGISVKWDDLRKKARKAMQTPASLNVFLRLHMNMWTESETRWIPADAWAACSFPVDPDGLRGRQCYGGLDLSSNRDLTAFALVFPPLTEEDSFKALLRFWIPEDNVQERVHNDRVSYDVWIRQGFIKTTPGNVTDKKFIVSEIGELAEKYDIIEVAFDRWGASQVIADLQEMGFEKDNEHAQRHLIAFGQGFKDMSPPMKELENLIFANKIAHGGNPVLAWNASNVVAVQDPAENIKPDKNKSIERIDGVVALIMGLDRALKHNEYTNVCSVIAI